MECPNCAGRDLIKRGRKAGYQRYSCRGCGRYCTDRPVRFDADTKAMAIKMYMNSVGIRSIGRIVGASPAAVLKWIRKDHAALQQRLAAMLPERAGPDIIEMDEIYTCIQKNISAR